MNSLPSTKSTYLQYIQSVPTSDFLSQSNLSNPSQDLDLYSLNKTKKSE